MPRTLFDAIVGRRLSKVAIVEPVAVDRPRIDVERQFAAGDRLVGNVGVVEATAAPRAARRARATIGLLSSDVFLDLEMHGAQVEDSCGR